LIQDHMSVSNHLPERISPDAILEAIVELRFAADELPEVFLGRLLTSSALRDLRPIRLPQADIPFAARDADSTLRYQPIYQLELGNELVRIGTGAVSYHRLSPYGDWEGFFGRAKEIIAGTWAEAGAPPLERCGLRYVNALTAEGHGVETIEDLNLAVTVCGQELVDISLSFLADDTGDTETLVRVASAKHIQGDIPEDSTFAVDIDVRTSSDVSNWNIDRVYAWLAEARLIKNKHFFELIPARIVETLQV
jgi:uncharacterized protein (TIGR04255 family)